ncbi:hypothetical protein EBME_0128 [bacterium endosymbiont of Mortierella elongata FMR23-6]|nr:hypothetical protein EBME_0128 [bacterium endosymbiont of Mortierella elongata FMR23-6]
MLLQRGCYRQTSLNLNDEPTGISLSEIAEVNAFNANVCYQWREQALGLRAFYRKLQHIQAMP